MPPNLYKAHQANNKTSVELMVKRSNLIKANIYQKTAQLPFIFGTGQQ